MSVSSPKGKDKSSIDYSKMPCVDGKLTGKFHFYINNIGEIDPVKNIAPVDVGFACIWNDHRMVNHKGDVPSDLWGPRVNLWNSDGVPEIIVKDFRMIDAAKGTLTRTFRFVTPVVNEKHESYPSFPFDFTAVTMKLTQSSQATLFDGTLLEAPSGEFLLYPVEEGDPAVMFQLWTFTGQLSLWRMVAMACSTIIFPSTDPNYPDTQSIKVDFLFKRKPAYFGWKVIFPLLLLMIAAFLVFAIPVDDIADRLNYALTSLLAGFALMFVITTDVPKSGALTNIDKLIFSSIITILLQSAAVVIFYFVNSANLPTSGIDINMFGGIFLAGLYAICVFYTVVKPSIAQRTAKPSTGEKAPNNSSYVYVTMEDLHARSLIHG